MAVHLRHVNSRTSTKLALCCRRTSGRAHVHIGYRAVSTNHDGWPRQISGCAAATSANAVAADAALWILSNCGWFSRRRSSHSVLLECACAAGNVRSQTGSVGLRAAAAAANIKDSSMRSCYALIIANTPLEVSFSYSFEWLYHIRCTTWFV